MGSFVSLSSSLFPVLLQIPIGRINWNHPQKRWINLALTKFNVCVFGGWNSIQFNFHQIGALDFDANQRERFWNDLGRDSDKTPEVDLHICHNPRLNGGWKFHFLLVEFDWIFDWNPHYLNQYNATCLYCCAPNFESFQFSN